MPTPNKKLAIVIPVWNNWSYTKTAISHLDRLPDDHKLFIIDNGSQDDTSKLLPSKKLDIIRNKENLFFAKACNQGFTSAVDQGFPYVMFLNNDIRVFGNPDCWTAPLITAAEKGYLVGPTAGCLDNNLNFICEAPKIPTRGHWYVSGWCITASVQTWNKLIVDEGPFSTEFTFYFEDTDLGFRAKQLNISSLIIPVPVKHLGKASSKKLGVSNLYLNAKPIFMNKWKNKV
ncbi:MAG: glycosyltransferase [Clostridia bacterium]|jgi:GT2 family glycosyltransferase